MKSIYLLLLLLFFNSFLLAQSTNIGISPIDGDGNPPENPIPFPENTNANTVKLIVNHVNNVPLNPSSPINFGGQQNITVSMYVEVSLSSPPSNNNPGNVTIFWQKDTAFLPVIANGGFTQNLLFNGSTFATASFSVTLNTDAFAATGGFIYAQYKTASGIVYKSSNRSVVKNAPVVVNPTPVVPPTCSLTFGKQTIPYNGIPIIPNEGSNARYNDPIYGDFIHSWEILKKYPNADIFESTRGQIGNIRSFLRRQEFNRSTYRLKSTEINNPQNIKYSMSLEITTSQFYPDKFNVNVKNQISTNSNGSLTTDILYPTTNQSVTIFGDSPSVSYYNESRGISGEITEPLLTYYWEKREIAPTNPLAQSTLLVFPGYCFQIPHFNWTRINDTEGLVNYTPPIN
jgi:hypothetical protein